MIATRSAYIVSDTNTTAGFYQTRTYAFAKQLPIVLAHHGWMSRRSRMAEDWQWQRRRVSLRRPPTLFPYGDALPGRGAITTQEDDTGTPHAGATAPHFFSAASLCDNSITPQNRRQSLTHFRYVQLAAI